MNRDEIIAAVRQHVEGKQEIECKFISTYSDEEIFVLGSGAESLNEAIELVIEHSRNNVPPFLRGGPGQS